MDEKAFARTVERMAELISSDGAIREGSQGVEFSVLMEATDFGVKLFIKFTGTEVEASVGEPPEEPVVELAMDSSVFDGMFKGETDPMSAAMSGDMSFSGDAGPAMALQDLMDDFVRCYTQAKGETA